MSCTGVNILMADTQFLCGSLHIANQLLVPVYRIPVPCLLHLAGTACPGLIGTSLYNGEYLFQYLGILMPGIEGKIKVIRHTGMYTGVDTTSPVVYTSSGYPSLSISSWR